MENKIKIDSLSFVFKMDNWEKDFTGRFYCEKCGEIEYYITDDKINSCPECECQSVYETKKDFIKARRNKVLKRVLYEM